MSSGLGPATTSFYFFFKSQLSETIVPNKDTRWGPCRATHLSKTESSSRCRFGTSNAVPLNMTNCALVPPHPRPIDWLVDNVEVNYEVIEVDYTKLTRGILKKIIYLAIFVTTLYKNQRKQSPSASSAPVNFTRQFLERVKNE